MRTRYKRMHLPRLRISLLPVVLLALIFCAARLRLRGEPQQSSPPQWVAPATAAVDGQVQKIRQSFIVYEDSDSGYNHGTFSGFFGLPLSVLSKLTIDTACVPSGNPPRGCSTDPTVLDTAHGTVIRFTFQPLSGTEYVGVSCVEPANLFLGGTGAAYDLRGITQLSFDAMSPDAAGTLKVQFGFGGSTPPTFQTLSNNWQHIVIPWSSQNSLADLSAMNILFTIVTNAAYAPNGGTVLVDNIRFDAPTAQATAPGFPVAFQTYGVLPISQLLPPPITVPPDILYRNQAPIDTTAWTASLLTALGGQWAPSAKLLLDSFVSVAAHPNAPLSPAPAQGGQGLLACYSSGDVGLKNADPSGVAAGSSRPCGFTLWTPSGPTYQVIQGESGGENAAVILALLRGYKAFNNDSYRTTAIFLANWIQGALEDTTNNGYGGYFYGFELVQDSLQKLPSKTTVDNALIYSAFTALADVETALGNSDAANWRGAAGAAGQFVQAMYRLDGRFYTGTVPDTQPTDLDHGIRADGPRKGHEIINSYDFIENYTLVPLSLYASNTSTFQPDLQLVMKDLLTKETSVSTPAGQLPGFFSAEPLVSGGVDWIYTETANLALQVISSPSTVGADVQAAAQKYLSEVATLEQSLATGGLIPAASLNNQSSVPPYSQCLVSPFGCEPGRPSLAATVLAIAAANQINLFALTPPLPTVITSVLNGATNTASISPGANVLVFGSNLPTSASAGALVGGQPASVQFTSAGQWVIAIPYTAAPGPSTIQVGASAPFNVTLNKYAPGLFTMTIGGQTIAVAVPSGSSSQVTPSSPAMPGSVYFLSATGLGAIDSSGNPSPTPTVTVGGVAATVLSAAATSTPGLYQVKIQLDGTTSSGNQQVILSIGGISSPSATLPVGVITKPIITDAQNGATFQSGIVANSWMTIKGGLLSSVTDTWANAVINGVLPTTLDGVKVSVGGKPAYIYYVNAGQINAVAPDIPAGPTTVTVTNSVGTTSAFAATASLFGPAFFLWPNNYAAATHLDYSYAVKNGTFGVATVPAKPGETIVLWGMGFGPTNPAAPVGVAVPYPPLYPSANTVTVTIGGVNAPQVTAVLAPGAAAEYQLAVQIPASLADGDYPIVATVNGVSSPSTTLITVQH